MEKDSQEHSIQFRLLLTCRQGSGVTAAIWEEFVFVLNCRRYYGFAGYEGEGGRIC